MEHILPLGSIVHIKTDTQTDYMIVNRAALYQEGKQVGYFNYAAVIYPDGLNANNELTFLTARISPACFLLVISTKLNAN